MAGYIPLFSSLISSSVWNEDSDTCKVWITLMAMSNKDGLVEGSAVGIAPIARVSVEACKAAIKILESPDKDSRSKEYEGRRLLPIEGGWRLVNHEKYRKLAQSRAAYFQAWREQRKQQQSAINPSLQQVKDECFKQGLPDNEADLLYAHYQEVGWITGLQNPVLNLSACVAKWRLRKPDFDAKKLQGTKSGGTKTTRRNLGADSNIASAYGDEIQTSGMPTVQKDKTADSV